MTRRRRSDSVTTATEVVNELPIDPPEHVHLRDRDLPFWYSIVRARANDSWNEADLELAGNLARCKSDIERIQEEVDLEGDTLTNAKGTVVMNPKHSLLETLSRRAVALSRALHVHAEATQGRSRDTGERSKQQQAVRDGVDKASSQSDGLIPRASTH